MSTALPAVLDSEHRHTETLTCPERVQSFLDLLTDPDCRAMMAATTDESLTARELADAVGSPLSTTYRKLDDLTDAGILVGRTRLGCGGSHASEYHRVVDDVVVSVGSDDGAVLAVSTEGSGDRPTVAGQ